MTNSCFILFSTKGHLSKATTPDSKKIYWPYDKHRFTWPDVDSGGSTA